MIPPAERHYGKPSGIQLAEYKSKVLPSPPLLMFPRQQIHFLLNIFQFFNFSFLEYHISSTKKKKTGKVVIYILYNIINGQQDGILSNKHLLWSPQDEFYASACSSKTHLGFWGNLLCSNMLLFLNYIIVIIIIILLESAGTLPIGFI